MHYSLQYAWGAGSRRIHRAVIRDYDAHIISLCAVYVESYSDGMPEDGTLCAWCSWLWDENIFLDTQKRLDTRRQLADNSSMMILDEEPMTQRAQPDSMRVKRITVRLDLDIVTPLEEEAHAEHLKLVDIVRRALLEHIERRKRLGAQLT
jgi:hypothetical protein